MRTPFFPKVKSTAKRVAAHMLCAAAVAVSSVATHAAELGVYRWDAPSGPANIDAFNQWLGRPATIGAPFEAQGSWDDIDGAAWQLSPWSQWVRAKAGRNISLAVPMMPSSGGSLASCAAGEYDARWTTLANELNYYGLHWAYLRLGWEMDGTWYKWSAAPGSGKEASFAGCFRRIVQVMRQAQPANQWKFVLNPTVGWRSKSYLDAVWPGDAYVDVVAIDFYDQSWASNTYPYPSNCDAACRATRQQNAWNDYSQLLYTLRDFAIAHGKKMALPEWGVAIRPDGHGGGDNPSFIRKMHEFIENPANNVAYHVYWDVAASDLNAQLSGSTRFPESAAVFRQLFGTAAPAPTPTNTPPTVSITTPAAGRTVSGTVSYAANATDNAGVTRVQFLVGSTALASDNSAPYGGSLDTTKLANGTHVLKATAYDAQGLSATSQVSINVQNSVATPAPGGGSPGTAPTIAFTAPAVGGALSGNVQGPPHCTVAGANIARVMFYLNGVWTNTDGNLSNGLGCWIDTTKYRNGTYTVKAVAYNAAGQTATAEREVTIQNGSTPVPTPTPPTSGAPTIGFTAPAVRGVLTGNVQGPPHCTVTGANIARVMFYLNGEWTNTDGNLANGLGCWIDTTKYRNGTYTVKAVAYNAAGQTASAEREVTIQNGTSTPTPPANGLPTIAFTAPAVGGVLSGNVQGPPYCTVTGANIARVMFYLNGAWTNTDGNLSNGLGCWIDTRRYSNGTYTVKAVAYNAAGQTATVERLVTIRN